jgi:hypothetical protein
VSERFVKCSKAGCPCATDDKARHGPYFSWTRVVNGKTQSRLLTAEQAAVVKKQIEAGHRFRNNVEDYWRACEVWADQELTEPTEPTAEAVKKRGSPPRSKRKLSKRSGG